MENKFQQIQIPPLQYLCDQEPANSEITTWNGSTEDWEKQEYLI